MPRDALLEAMGHYWISGQGHFYPQRAVGQDDSRQLPGTRRWLRSPAECVNGILFEPVDIRLRGMTEKLKSGEVEILRALRSNEFSDYDGEFFKLRDSRARRTQTLVANFGTTSVASSGNVWVRTGLSPPAEDIKE